MYNLEILKKYISTSDNIVLLTGAGISCASGIPDFRSEKGIFSQKVNEKYSTEQILSHNFIMSKPKEFYDFYNSNMVYPNSKPNLAHFYFANLEKEGKLKAIITQNIDGLHQKAGSKNVLELHGSVLRNYCTNCQKTFDVNYIVNAKGVPYCDNCKSMVRPDVVLYGEALDNEVFDKAEEYIAKCDCLIVVGTSLVVQPAASLVDCYKGNKMVLINKQSTPYDRFADLILNEDIIEVIKGLGGINAK